MSAFNNMVNKVRDRNWGGTSSQIACEPYVSGYSFIKFLHMPTDLSAVLATDLETVSQIFPGANQLHTTQPADNTKLAGNFLEHAMNSVTPPGGTINEVEINGLGGLKWGVPGSMDYGNSISIKYLEFSGLPIARIHRAWCNMIRDNRMGTTHMDNGGAGHGMSYIKENYSATMAYWTTKPDGVTVEFAAIYTGMFPSKDPMDLFSGDITSVDKLEIEIEYNVDMIYNDSSAYAECQQLAKSHSYGTAEATTWEGYTGDWSTSARGGAENTINMYKKA